MTHTDEKPHVCEECDSAYKTLDALQRHQRSVALLWFTGVSPFFTNNSCVVMVCIIYIL